MITAYCPTFQLQIHSYRNLFFIIDFISNYFSINWNVSAFDVRLNDCRTIAINLCSSSCNLLSLNRLVFCFDYSKFEKFSHIHTHTHTCNTRTFWKFCHSVCVCVVRILLKAYRWNPWKRVTTLWVREAIWTSRDDDSNEVDCINVNLSHSCHIKHSVTASTTTDGLRVSFIHTCMHMCIHSTCVYGGELLRKCIFCVPIERFPHYNITFHLCISF